MISVDEMPVVKHGGKYDISFSGLSTDDKPKKTYEHKGKVLGIANGSSFFEMDTQSLKFYDESIDDWV